MTARMSLYDYEGVVRTLCPTVVAEMGHSDRCTDEYILRREIVACVLGSQVTHDAAQRALSQIDAAGLLADEWWSISDGIEFEARVLELLESIRGDSHEDTSCYRFPRLRSRQLAQARDAIALMPLAVRLGASNDARDLRRQLIRDIAGVGPKQASLFLRNVRVSFDLAVLDRHVLRYFAILGILPDVNVNIATIRAYENVEDLVIEYAESLDCPVGCLDVAIWVTMKAAREGAR